MKKMKLHLLLIGILIVLSGVWSCSGGGGSSAPPAYSGVRQWTYMVYMGADNNLSDEGLSDLKEMEQVGSSAGVAVVVQAEFSPTYSSAAGITSSQTGRVLVQKNVDSLTAPDGILVGNVDMASPAALTDFITWAKTTYPAQHYALVVWDHGGGWKANKFKSFLKGAVQDETSGHFMSLPDLAKGVRDSNVHFDVINFDACLMAMYEVAYEFNGLTDYMAFSEQTEPGEGDPYNTILGALGADPLMTARDLASTIVDKYDQFYMANDRGGTTKSAVDMSKLAVLDAKLLALAAALKNDGASSPVVLQAESNTQEYSYPSNHDIWDFSDYLVNSAAGTAVKTAAADVKTAVVSMVVDNQTNGTDMAHSHGLALYLPSASETNAQELADYALLASNKTTRAAASGTWGSYLETLLTGAGGGTATYHAGNFGFYASWTNLSDQPCDADLDLYVWEPDGAGGAWYAPYMGQSSPNGFFSSDSSVSGKSEEYYLANSQVLAGDYYLMVNFYANGASCTQAKARLYYYDQTVFGDSNWHEATTAIGVDPAVASPVMLDLSNIYSGQTLTNGLRDLNNYSDWWVPFFITKAQGTPQVLGAGSLPAVNKRTQMLLRYKKGTRLFGSGF